MSGFKKEEREKIFRLEDSALNDSPEEIARVYKELGRVAFSARALGIACRFRGVDAVRALVEGGASFRYDAEVLKGNYKYFFIDAPMEYPHDFSQFLIKNRKLIGDYTVYRFLIDLRDRNGNNPPAVSDGERAEVAEYLCGVAERVGFVPGELLYYAVVTDDTEMIAALKRHGAEFTEERKELLTKKGCKLFHPWEISDEEILRVLSGLVAEVGGRRLHTTNRYSQELNRRLSNPEVLRFFLENFDQSNTNKKRRLEEFILADNAECLGICAEAGWFKTPKKRDELIAFASENGKTECTAYLLDFKNRTADLKAERERAEKKAERLLNAAPDSAAVVGQFLSFKKRADGTVIINGYKGDGLRVTVPESIGGAPVTAIGEYAFSPDAKRIRREQRENRKAVMEIVLPDTITEIGEFAFYKCRSLGVLRIPPRISEIPKGMLNLSGISSVEVGGNVRRIGMGAFYGCGKLRSAVLREGVEEIYSAAFYNCGALETLELPRSVVKIFHGDEWNNFFNCDNMTIVLHKGSYAEEFCAENKIPFKYKEEE